MNPQSAFSLSAFPLSAFPDRAVLPPPIGDHGRPILWLDWTEREDLVREHTITEILAGRARSGRRLQSALADTAPASRGHKTSHHQSADH